MLKKITLQDLKTILNSDVVKSNLCIEINFSIDNDPEYEDCWIGKTIDKNKTYKEVYWYGLATDASQAYNYDKLEDILNAKVFHGKSLCDVIDKMTCYSLDGCSVEEKLPDYID